MIYLKIDGNTYEINADTFEDTLLDNGIPKLVEAMDGMGMGGKQVINSSISMLLSFMNLAKPKELKDMDNIEYATRIAINMLLDNLDGQTLEVADAKKVVEDDKEEEHI